MANKKLKLTKVYDVCGSKNPRLTVVLIHGIASDSEATYAKILNHFKEVEGLKEIRFVAFDLLGSGKSLKDDGLNYDYKEQIEALHNSISALNIKTPLVLVGHSLGTFIVTRYANTYKKSVKELVLISPPIYTLADLENPRFAAGIEMFKDMVSIKNRGILKDKAFNNSMENIVLNKDNYSTLASINIPVIMIYGEMDQFIGAYNIPKLLKDNSNVRAIRTLGRHGVSRDKYGKIVEVLEEVLDA